MTDLGGECRTFVGFEILLAVFEVLVGMVDVERASRCFVRRLEVASAGDLIVVILHIRHDLRTKRIDMHNTTI